jgi:hemerythrin-like domain-containing protein
MQRYNIFYQVHKGLRALLFETAIFLQQVDFTREVEIEEVKVRINELICLFEGHAHTEDHFILPAIETYEPSIADAFEGEHKEDAQLSRRLKDVLRGLLDTDNDYDRAEFGKSINLLFVEFVVFNLAHMAKEESVLNKFLWRYYGDDELKQITKEIIAEHKTEDIKRFNKWMLRGLNNNEIIVWLKNIKDNAPCYVFQELIQQASEEINSERWMQIQEQLTEGVQLA